MCYGLSKSLLTILFASAEAKPDIRAVCLASPIGRLESNYVRLCTRKNIAETFLPVVTLLCFLGFHLLLEKNTDGTLELMCSGINGP